MGVNGEGFTWPISVSATLAFFLLSELQGPIAPATLNSRLVSTWGGVGTSGKGRCWQGPQRRRQQGQQQQQQQQQQQ